MSVKQTEWRNGWRNVLAAAIGLGFGIPSYGPVASLFLRSLETQFDWSKAVAAGALFALPLSALVLPFVGRMIDRIGVRPVVAFSVLCSTICFVALSRLSGSVEQYYALIMALYILGCATGPIAYTRLVAAQFREARGMALAVAQFGIALIAIMMPPLIGGIMAEWSWREAYLVFAATSLLGGLTALLLMQPVLPPADAEVAGSESGGAWVLLRQGSFWIIGLPILLISIAAYGFVFQAQSLLISVGAEPRTAILMLSVLAFSTMISRLVVGRLLDSSRPALLSAAVMFVAALGPALLLLPSPPLLLIILAVACIGISIGAELDFMSFFCARLFGMRHYSAVYGMLSIFFFVGMAVGGVGFAAIYDATASFRPALLTMAGLLLGSALLFLLMDRKDRANIGVGTDKG